MGMSHRRLQQVIAWLPLSRVCSIVAAPCGWSKPDAFWPRKYWNEKYENVFGKRSNKSLSNKTLADSFYNDELSCFSTAQSLHRRTLLKRHTLSHIYCHIQTELNNSKNENSPGYKYPTVLSTGSKKSSVWRHCPESTQQSLLTSDPPQIPSQQDSAERKWKHLFNPVCDTKLTTDPKSW